MAGEALLPLPNGLAAVGVGSLGVRTPECRSFRDVLSGKGSGNADISSIKSSTFQGKPALIFSEEQISSLAAPFALTLIGKFPSRRPNMEIIRKFFIRLKLTGLFEVALLDDHHITIKLENDLDYARIFSRRAYYIAKCQMGVLKWSPNFDPKEESPIVPIWLALPNIRLHFINQSVLFAIGSFFGRPLHMDHATATLKRPSVARILVELDISKHHPAEVWLGSNLNGYFQSIVFENMPLFCKHCKLHGHDLAGCFSMHPHLNIRKNAVGNTQNIGDNSPQLNPHAELFHPELAPSSLDLDPLVGGPNVVVNGVDSSLHTSALNSEIHTVMVQPNLLVDSSLDKDAIVSTFDLIKDSAGPEVDVVSSNPMVQKLNSNVVHDQHLNCDPDSMEFYNNFMKDLGSKPGSSVRPDAMDSSLHVGDELISLDRFADSECFGSDHYNSEPYNDDFIKFKKKKRGKNKVHVKAFRITRSSSFTGSLQEFW